MLVEGERSEEPGVAPICASVGISEADRIMVQVYPNPADKTLFIKNLPLGKRVTVHLLNSLGQSLISQTIDGSKGLDISNLQAGVYVVEIEMDAEIYRHQVIVF